MAKVGDPIQLEVLRNTFEGIADQMALTVHRTSRSAVVRTSHDFSTGVLSPSAELIAQGISNPGHLGGMGPALEACLAYFKDRVHPGDILINNDPYEGGSHLPDIFLYKPVFVGDILVAWLCTRMKPNIYLELSMWQSKFKYTGEFLYAIDRMRDTIGIERIIWGSDFPGVRAVMSMKEWVDIFRRLPSLGEEHGYRFDDKDVDALLGGNAARILKLS